MGCTKKVITLDSSVSKFVFRNEVRLTSIALYTNSVDVVSVNFNDIPTYQGVLGNVPSGITIPSTASGFMWFPVDLEVIQIDFDCNTDNKAICVVTFNEISNNGTIQNKTY
jgi:hypothetical protein